MTNDEYKSTSLKYRKVAPNWNTMLKPAYALHKLRVKHATQ